MEFKSFVTQLSQIHEAVSAQGKHYTEIHVSGTHIEYTRESNSRESIDIQELFNVYEKASHINTSILRNYITGRKYSPALAILKAAGFYNEKGVKVKLPFKEREINELETATFPISVLFNNDTKNLETKLDNIISNESKIPWIIMMILLGAPIVFIIIAIFFYWKSTNIYATALFAILILSINVAYFFYLIQLKKNDFHNIKYSSYLTLMIFNVGIFPLYTYVKDYEERNKVIVNYTVGFRSWGTEVKYSDIKVYYYDKFGNPYKLEDSVVNKSKNWISNLWTDKNKINHFKKDSVNFDFINGNISITIRNCGAILDPNVFKPKAISFFVDAKLNLKEIDPAYKKAIESEKYQSSQICLKVPVEIDTTKTIKDIYYAFEFLYSNFSWSKLRIPGFNFDYTNSQLDYLSNYTSSPQNLYAKHIIGGINTTIFNQNPKDPIKAIEENDTIHLSAVLFDDNAAFHIIKPNSSHSLPLFNFNISKYGALNLIEK